MSKNNWLNLGAAGVLCVLLILWAFGGPAWAAPGAQGTVPGAGGGPIGNGGGTVGGGNVLVSVPPGVVPNGTRLSIFAVSPVAPPPVPGGFLVGGAVYQITATGPSNRAITKFANPLTICFLLTDTQIELAGGSDAVIIQWYNPTTGQWENLVTTRTPGTNQFCTAVNHLSVFGVFAPPSSAVQVASNEEANWIQWTPWAAGLSVCIVLGIVWLRRRRK